MTRQSSATSNEDDGDGDEAAAAAVAAAGAAGARSRSSSTALSIGTPASGGRDEPLQPPELPPKPLRVERCPVLAAEKQQSAGASGASGDAVPEQLVTSAAAPEPVQKKPLTKSQVKEFREAFRLFDKDGDGRITKEELGRVMRSLGQFARAEELRTMLEEIDIDGDGTVSFEEFVEIVSNQMGGSASSSSPTDQFQEEQELRDAFRVFDKRNRGYITASDLRAVLQCLGEDLSEEEIEDMIAEVDVDGDGRIDFYEFVRALGEPGIEDDDDDDDEDEDEDEEELGAVGYAQAGPSSRPD